MIDFHWVECGFTMLYVELSLVVADTECTISRTVAATESTGIQSASEI